MKVRLLLAGVFLLAASTSAIAAGPYVGGDFGFSVFHDSDLSVGGSGQIQYRLGAGIDLTAGYDFDGFRLEGEFGIKSANVDTFQGNKVAKGEMDTTIDSYMINGFWDMKRSGRVAPFLGVGIGMLRAEMTDSYGAYEDDALGFQLSAGAGIKLLERLTLDLSYRYQAAANDFHIGSYDVSYASSSFLGGVRYRF